MKYSYLLLTFIVFGINLSAQTIKLSGKVLDDKTNEPLIGATVSAKGFSAATTVDINGNFTLITPIKTTQLICSYIGYISQTVIIKDMNPQKIIVNLTEKNKELDEVVVVGYGNMRKSDITGSVTRVNPNEIEASSSTSIQSLIQGRAAGVQILSSDGAPGSDIEFTIRGASSLSKTAPLYVVDGIIMNSSLNDISVISGDKTQNGLTGVNPQDIANIEILKDASATAIYGALGANGVVLITTKTGSGDRPKIQYTSGLTFSTMANKRRMLTFDEYVIYQRTDRNLAFPIDGIKPIDWQDYVTRDALSQNHRFSVTGKSKQTSYYVAGGITTNEGIIKNTNSNSSDIRINIDQIMSPTINFGVKSALTRLFVNMAPGDGNRLSSSVLLGMRTTAPYINQVPTISDVSLDVEDLELTQGPLPYLVDAKDYSEEYRTVSSLYFNVKLNDEFSMRTTLGIDYRNKSRQAWNGVTTSLGKTLGGQASYGTLEGLTYNIDHMFNYNKKINKHSFNGLAGVTLVSSNNFNYVISTTQFQGNVLAREEGIMYGTVIDIPTYSKSFFNTLSFLGRLVYSYDNRYILTTTFRADGSSKFEGNNKFSYFPSMALAYRLDQESFIKKLEAISNLKIRLGWGLVGNQSIAAFSTLQGYSGSRLSEPDGSSSLAIYPSNLPNKDLKWESSSQYNAGIDFGMFDNRVVLTVDAYHKMSKDLLQTINISQSAGFSTMSINRGSIRNQGVEISLDVTPIRTKDFSITLNGNISRNDNKIIDIGLEEGTFGAHTFKAYSGGGIGTSGTTSLTLMMIEGYPVSQFFGYKTDGIVQVADFERDRQVRTANYLALNPSANPTTLTEAQLQSVKGTLPAITAAYQYTTNPLLLQPGDPKYVDMNGDGIIDLKDGTLLGSPLPDFIYGFGITMRYKELSLMANFNGVSGNKIANADRTREENVLAINNGNITKYAYDNMYRPSAPSNLVPRYNYFGAIGNFLDTYIEDGSFLRLSSLSLSYNHKLKKRNVISGFGLSITGRNLFCLTKYMGYDPEISSFANDPMRAGISWSSYPRSRSYIAGLTIDF